MKALLVSPRLPLSFWNFQNVLKIIDKKAVYIPLGLITAAALMPRDWDLKLVDMNAQRLTDGQIRWADMVFAGAMIVQKESMREVVDRAHRLGKQVVVGGPLFHHGVEREFSDVDFRVLDEAEITLPRFVRDLAAGSPAPLYRSDEKCDIGKSPVPRWDLLDNRLYASMSVQFSRGCPYRCEFCDIPILQGRRFRSKTADQVLRELSALYKTGWRGRIFIADDNFIGERPRVKSLLVKIAAWQTRRGRPFVFTTEASIDLAGDRELMALMNDAGFKGVFIGLETPDQETLHQCGKYQNSRVNLLQAVRTIQASGLQVSGGFIVGFDNDQEDIFDRQIRFIQESGIVTAMIGILYALPGTRLYQRLKEEGRLMHASCTGSNTDGQITFMPKMGVEALVAGYRKVLEHIYSPHGYHERILRFLEHYRPVRRRPLHWGDIAALFRSVWYVGICNGGNSRKFYWRTVFHALFFRQRCFAEIMESAVFAYHFQTQVERIRMRPPGEPRLP
jgi:radical SAM superfamily enzyme YgiQ (UPF0313 family)